MNDICVPLPRLSEVTHAEVEVKIQGRLQSFNYRVESFAWRRSDQARIERLRKSIQGYERGWELVQIYNPGPRDRHVQVLFRQRM